MVKGCELVNLKAGEKMEYRILEIRKQKGFSQKDLSEVVEVDKAYISRVERGKQQPSVESLHKIATALGVTIDDLIK
jgi:transcriptional regulator with XRE-family HTH domain